MRTVTLQPLGAVLSVQPNERILQAACRLGFHPPQSCRNGACHICAATLLSGQVKQQGQILAEGEIFTCLAEPLADCTLHWEAVLTAGELPRRRIACQLVDCTDSGADVFRVLLRAPAGAKIRYHAGQYLRIERDNGESRAFSIASTPDCGRELELHILAREQSAKDLLTQLQRERLARVELPFGNAHLAQLPGRPLLLIAAGTGMAQMQSLVDSCLLRGFNYPIYLYWGARLATDFYHLPHWDDWQQAKNIHLCQVVSEDNDWQGRRGLLHQAVCADFRGQLKKLQTHICGSPEMVYATCDALIAAGMAQSQMHADVFSYAPRQED
ncbi:CDP-6-deoxy-delta-3,4-glucoseen reductase [Ventosimonas gracilis]|uniref:CDP-6-deoxy-delta-3,4-glucoseen reductase n=1 Tax=Ventosimonas gracilis TaxID=1680762 RepID=A0A139SXQ9_9GAMM|nr:2Fe-2S iron-sulfur cluster-binding protein [Ventosimonas gracilis]KXU39181.1 CDP-6-deoxy-delta-3,4-glucoseen reductase [Ventosimonas gracilis]